MFFVALVIVEINVLAKEEAHLLGRLGVPMHAFTCAEYVRYKYYLMAFPGLTSVVPCDKILLG